MVYVLYTKRNPPYSSPLQCFAENARPSAYKGDPNYVPPVDRKDVNKLVIDASTYEVLLYEQYVDSVTDDNLITSTRYSLKYSNVSVAEALRAMTAAGFDKTTALPTMPAGRD